MRMNNFNFNEFGLWYVIWYVYYGVLELFLVPHGVTFSKKRILTVVYSSIWFVFISALFKPGLFSESIVIGIVVFGVLVILDLLFFPVRNLIKKGYPSIGKRRNSPFLTRMFDILFQQTMVAVMVNIFLDSRVKFPLLLAGLSFGFVHFPLLFVRRLPFKWSAIVVGLAFGGGIAFSYLIGGVEYGRLISFIIHGIFYYILALVTGKGSQIMP